jgi:hypothetical protein
LLGATTETDNGDVVEAYSSMRDGEWSLALLV